ncbi:ArsR family transcriptional regulator [Jatrophihabitans endophyticus]|uniref:ArsR family transcriptional regulator n=1 Tax=Jatrophihabitans endophyticus TaxID=1206085 RepID=UPI000934CA20
MTRGTARATRRAHGGVREARGAELGGSQPLVSTHLRALREAGLGRRSRGRAALILRQRMQVIGEPTRETPASCGILSV